MQPRPAGLPVFNPPIQPTKQAFRGLFFLAWTYANICRTKLTQCHMGVLPCWRKAAPACFRLAHMHAIWPLFQAGMNGAEVGARPARRSSLFGDPMIYAAPGAAGAKVQYKTRYDNFIGGKFVAPSKASTLM
jgi:hypothetical protein